MFIFIIIDSLFRIRIIYESVMLSVVRLSVWPRAAERERERERERLHSERTSFGYFFYLIPSHNAYVIKRWCWYSFWQVVHKVVAYRSTSERPAVGGLRLWLVMAGCVWTDKHQGRQSRITRLPGSWDAHRMTHFLPRPNKSAQLIIDALHKIAVSSSSSDVNY